MQNRDAKRYTISDIYALPEGKRAELIDGEMFMMAPPNSPHQKISAYLTRDIMNYIEAHNGTCELYAAPFAVFLNADDQTYVEPDISVICNPEKVEIKGCVGAPDWIIEIVSTSSKTQDYIRKTNAYLTAGVREYWIVDPKTRQVTKYLFTSAKEEMQLFVYPFDQRVPCDVISGFQMDFSRFI